MYIGVLHRAGRGTRIVRVQHLLRLIRRSFWSSEERDHVRAAMTQCVCLMGSGTR